MIAARIFNTGLAIQRHSATSPFSNIPRLIADAFQFRVTRRQPIVSNKMMRYQATLLLALTASVASPCANTAVPEWRVVLSAPSSTASLPQLPPGAYSMSPLPGELSDSAAATLGFNLTRPDGRKGLWQEIGGALLPLHTQFFPLKDIFLKQDLV